MKKYHISIDGQQSGPHSLDEIKAMNLSDQDLVWQEGMSDWINVNRFTELKEFVKLTPPTLPVNRFQEFEIFRRTIIQSLILFVFLFILIFASLGGFNDKYDIEKNYKPTVGEIANFEDYQNNSIIHYLYINYDGDTIRYHILLPLSLVITISILMFIAFFKYRLTIIKEINRLKI